jgi:potassium efflux system protein
MSTLRTAPLLALLWLLLALAPALAADTAPVDQAREQLAAISRGLDKQTEDIELLRTRETVLRIQEEAQKWVAARTPELESLDARLAQLGEAPADGREPADVVRERKALQGQRNTLDAGLRQAGLAVVEAGQLLEQIASARQARFHDRLAERTTPPWRAAFWQDLADSAPRDLRRLDALWQQAARTVRTHWTAWPGRSAGLLGAALALVGLAGWLGWGWVPGLVAGKLPPGRLRRSAPALVRVAIATVAAVFITHLLRAALLPPRAPEQVTALADLAAGLAVFATFVTVLGSVLLSARRPSWRLPAISDAGARALRPFPLLAGLAIAAAIFSQRVGALANASLGLAVAITVAGALLTLLVVIAALFRVHRVQSTAVGDESGDGANAQADPAHPHFQPWVNAALSLGWVVSAIAVLGLFTGHVALSSFIAMQVLWTAVVLAAGWLAMRFIDDLACTLLGGRGLAGKRINTRFGIDARRLDQVAVVVSLLARIVVALLALMALAMPYGASGDGLIERVRGLQAGITIGQLVLSPGNIVRALLVFVLASVLFSLFQRWLSQRYLPTTKMDEGMRSSLASLTGYAGVVLAVAMALAAIGVSLERIAWIASALSVGIGFGLQAIVQNFISGLILLAERPVKVGDWVVVGDAEGDVRRINVRATEIQTSDRTTVLVPNSEFITKTVRNRTFSKAEGLVKIVLPMPLAVDPDLVRSLLLEVFQEHPGILDSPAPGVQIDNIDGGRIIFNATAYVASPRQAGATRSALLFEILRRMRALKIRME